MFFNFLAWYKVEILNKAICSAASASCNTGEWIFYEIINKKGYASHVDVPVLIEYVLVPTSNELQSALQNSLRRDEFPLTQIELPENALLDN